MDVDPRSSQYPLGRIVKVPQPDPQPRFLQETKNRHSGEKQQQKVGNIHTHAFKKYECYVAFIHTTRETTKSWKGHPGKGTLAFCVLCPSRAAHQHHNPPPVVLLTEIILQVGEEE